MLLNSEDFKKTVNVTKAFSFSRIRTHVRKIERLEIKPILGEELYEELQTYYEGTEHDNAESNSLLEIIHEIEANLAMWLHADMGNVIINDSGFQIQHSGDMKSAFQWQVANAQRGFMNTGFDAIDDLIDFLEKNADSFPTWETSEASTISRSLVVNTAKEFSQYIKISRRMYVLMLPYIARVERKFLKTTLGEEFYNEIKEGIKENAPNIENLALMPIINEFVTAQSYSMAILDLPSKVDERGVQLYNTAFSGNFDGLQPSDLDRIHGLHSRNQQIATDARAELIKFLNQNIDNYPLFIHSENYESEDDDEEIDLTTQSVIVL